MVDVKGDESCGFSARAEFLGLTEKSHIMIRKHLIQDVNYRRYDYEEWNIKKI